MKDMKIADIAVLGLALFMVLFKVLFPYIVGGGSMLFAFLFFFCIVAFFWGFWLVKTTESNSIDKKKGYSFGKLTIAFLLSAGLIMTCFSLLLTLQLWKPELFLWVSITLLCLIAVVSLLIYLAKKDRFYARVLVRAIFATVVAFGLLFTPPTLVVDVVNRTEPELRDAYKNALADPDNQGLWEKVREERELVRNKES